MGYWVDMSTAYWTMDPAYVQSVWWSLKQVFEKGLLVEDHRVAPYCPRCGTGLSDHEGARGAGRRVCPAAGVREGRAGRGPPGRAVLPALRRRPVRPRGGPGVRVDHRPV